MPNLTEVTKEAILCGMIMGDAGISKQHLYHGECRTGNVYLYWTHKEDNADYSIWKKDLLESLGYKISVGYGTTKQVNPAYTPTPYIRCRSRSLSEFLQLRSFWYNKLGKKQLHIEYLTQHFNAVSLAILYFDDGHIQTTGNRKTIVARIATNSFTLEEHLFMQTLLIERFGIDVHIGHTRQYLRLDFGVKSTQQLFDIITPILKDVPSMQYKLTGQELRDKKPAG